MRNSRLPRRIEKGPAPSDSRYGSHAGLFVIVASPPNSVSAAGSRPSMGCTAATLRVGVAWRRGVLLGRPRARPGNHGCAALRPAGCGTPGRLAAFLIRRPSCVAATRVFRLSWPLRVSLSSSVKRRYVYAARAFLIFILPAASRLTPRARGGLALWRGQSIRHIRGIPRAAPARPGARGRLNISFRRDARMTST